MQAVLTFRARQGAVPSDGGVGPFLPLPLLVHVADDVSRSWDLSKQDRDFPGVLRLTLCVCLLHSSKGPSRSAELQGEHSELRSRCRLLYGSQVGGQTFYNSEYGELSEHSEDGSCTPPGEGSTPPTLHASFFSEQY